MSTGRPHTRASIALLAGPIALVVVLSGCGGHDAGRPIPQRELSSGPTSTDPGYRTWFPREHVRVRVGQQVRLRGVPDVLAGFLAFQVGTARAVRTGRVPASVGHHATKPVQKLVRLQVDFLRSRGLHLDGRYRVGIRSVARQGTRYVLRVCVRQRGRVVADSGGATKPYRKAPASVGVLLVRQGGTGRWRVTAYQSLKKPLNRC